MPKSIFQKLSRAELDRYKAARSYPEYAEFLSGLKSGDAARVDVTKSGFTRQTVKNRLNNAADDLGIGLKYHRTGPDALVFEIVEK